MRLAEKKKRIEQAALREWLEDLSLLLCLSLLEKNPEASFDEAHSEAFDRLWEKVKEMKRATKTSHEGYPDLEK